MSDLNHQPDFHEEEAVSSEITEQKIEAPSEEVKEESADSATVLPSSPKKRSSFLKEALEYVEIFVFAVCVVVLLFSFVFRICTVRGGSMENTLMNEENLVVSNLFYTPERGDIIVFHQTGTLNEPVVKRVIATEGETVSIVYSNSSMRVTVTDVHGNSTVLDEEYVKYDGYQLYYAPTTVTVPEGCLFVMGDNRNDSMDSRHPYIGFVDERRVLGRVLFRLTPLNRMGAVK